MSFSESLPSLDEVERAATEGTLPALVADVRDGGRAPWLARALRVDLATINAHPTLAFPCVWNRAGAQPLLDAWRASHGARPWARSLRPPCFTLEGALLEEYRGDHSGASEIVIDAQTILLRGEASVGWDRERGLRVAVPDAPPRLHESWTIDRLKPGAHWGHYRIVDRPSGAIVLDARVNDDDSFDTFTVTADGRTIISGGWFRDYDGVVCAFARASGALQWRAELGASVDHVAASADGGVVAAFSSGRVTVLDGATGRPLAHAYVGATSGALDAAGRLLVTRTRDVVRVWDVASLGVGETLREVRRGFVDAEFSPDGRRLLTGAALCDAHDGRLIAALDVDGPGYLEGGPPERARALSNDRFVELRPFGVRAWDAITGQPLVNDGERHFMGGRDAVRVSRDGRHHVSAKQQWSAPELSGVAIFAVDDGKQVATIPSADICEIELSPDGGRLATGHLDGTVRVWRVPEGTLVCTCPAPGARVLGLTFAADGARVVARLESGLLRQLDARTGRMIAERTAGDADLERLHGWEGFRGRLHPYRMRREQGFLVVTHETDAHAPILIPTDHDPVFDEDGTRAAFRDLLVAIERPC